MRREKTWAIVVCTRVAALDDSTYLRIRQSLNNDIDLVTWLSHDEEETEYKCDAVRDDIWATVIFYIFIM